VQSECLQQSIRYMCANNIIIFVLGFAAIHDATRCRLYTNWTYDYIKLYTISMIYTLRTWILLSGIKMGIVNNISAIYATTDFLMHRT